MPRKLMLIIEAARGKKAEMCIRTGHAYRGQSERAIFPLVGVELVAPVQPESGKRSQLSFSKAITISTERDNANLFLVPFFAAHEIKLPVVIPKGTAGIIVSRKLQYGICCAFDESVAAARD